MLLGLSAPVDSICLFPFVRACPRLSLSVCLSVCLCACASVCLRTVPLPPPVALTHCFISHSQPFNFMSHITRYCLDVVMQRHCLPAGRPRMCTAQPASHPPFLCQCGVKPLALASWPPRNCQLPESNRVTGFVSRRQSPPTERCVHSTHTHVDRVRGTNYTGKEAKILGSCSIGVL